MIEEEEKNNEFVEFSFQNQLPYAPYSEYDQVQQQDHISRPSFSFTYNPHHSYHANFEKAYREWVYPDAAPEDVQRASQNYSLMVPMRDIHWFRGYIPLAAIESGFRSEFLAGGVYSA